MYKRIRKIIPVAAAKQSEPFNLRGKAAFDEQLKSVLAQGNKFLLIAGPCSADNHDAVLRYCEKLRQIAEKVSDKLFIVPRIYTTKPRSEAEAFRGMLHSPDCLHEDINKGILSARRLMIDVAHKCGFFAADEMLYPEFYPYFDDLVSYVTIGARSSENQMHRMAASLLEVPVGIKNPTNGNIESLVQAIAIAFKPNDFVYDGYEVKSGGNKYSHGILRGFSGHDGKMFANYSDEFLDKYILECKNRSISPTLIIDCSHCNSGKDYNKEPQVAMDVIKKVNNGYKDVIRGLMIESYLLDGKQNTLTEIGKSLSDGCLGIEKTERLIYDIASAL